MEISWRNSFLLTGSQKDVLKALVDIYRKKNKPIKSDEIAVTTGRSNGTIRNIMISLRALNFVESVAGPKGGYIPTPGAFGELKLPTGEWKEVPVRVGSDDGKLVKIDATVSELDLLRLPSPDESFAEITISGEMSQINVGAHIVIGPTPNTNLTLDGTIVGLYPSTGKILIEISKITSIPPTSIMELAIPYEKMVKINPETSIKDAQLSFMRQGFVFCL